MGFLRVKFIDKLPTPIYGIYEDWKVGKAYTARKEQRPEGVYYEVFYPGSPGGGALVPDTWVEIVK
jgi:hypothetical protein